MDEEATPAGPANPEVSGVVASVSPLTVVTDGATEACPAARIDDYSPVLGDRVRVKLQNPAPPIVQGKVTDDD